MSLSLADVDPCLCPLCQSWNGPWVLWMGRSTPNKALLWQGAKSPILSARLPPPIAASETSARDVLGEEGGIRKHLSPGRFGLFSAPW